MSEIISCGMLRTTAELHALAPAWIELWQSDMQATPFQRPEWLLPWWHSFGTNDLCALTVYRGRKLIAFLPLYLYLDPVRQEQQLLLLGAGTSDYLDGLFAPECTVQNVRDALETLQREELWEVAYLTQLRSDSLLRQAMLSLGNASVEPYSGEHTSRCPALAIRDLPKKLRADVLYFRNAAIGRGKLELRIADAVNCSALFESLVQQHTARWQNAGESGVLADPLVLAWHREAIPQLQGSGLLRLCALTLEGETIAVLYSLIDPEARADRAQYFYLNGHAPEHADLQPGTLLQALATEHALTEGVRTIDVLRGDEAYKQMWRVTVVPTFGFAWRRSHDSRYVPEAGLQVNDA